MNKLIALPLLATLGFASSALAQTTPAPPPPTGPTIVQCNQGYKDGMPWTREQFTKACVDLQAKNSGK